jgi:hypothetical protein
MGKSTNSILQNNLLYFKERKLFPPELHKRFPSTAGFEKDNFEFRDSFPFVESEILFRISPSPVSKALHCDPYQHANFPNLLCSSVFLPAECEINPFLTSLLYGQRQI